MSKVGFVYILVNAYMPRLFKVGCTERSPHERAAELSNHTGVPAPFDVLCYIETPEFQSVERELHQQLADCRVSSNREFFDDSICGSLRSAVELLYWFPERLSFTVPAEAGRPTSMQFLDVIALHELEQSTDPWSAPKDVGLHLVTKAPVTAPSNGTTGGFE